MEKSPIWVTLVAEAGVRGCWTKHPSSKMAEPLAEEHCQAGQVEAPTVVVPNKAEVEPQEGEVRLAVVERLAAAAHHDPLRPEEPQVVEVGHRPMVA